jgi:hypothetical protein
LEKYDDLLLNKLDNFLESVQLQNEAIDWGGQFSISSSSLNLVYKSIYHGFKPILSEKIELVAVGWQISCNLKGACQSNLYAITIAHSYDLVSSRFGSHKKQNSIDHMFFL